MKVIEKQVWAWRLKLITETQLNLKTVPNVRMNNKIESQRIFFLQKAAVWLNDYHSSLEGKRLKLYR